MSSYVAWAFILGVMCSVSLLIGALLGIYFKMSKRIVGLMAAFGAGALLSVHALNARTAATAVATIVLFIYFILRVRGTIQVNFLSMPKPSGLSPAFSVNGRFAALNH